MPTDEYCHKASGKQPQRHINMLWQLRTFQATQKKTTQANWECPFNWLVWGWSVWGWSGHMKLWKHPFVIAISATGAQFHLTGA